MYASTVAVARLIAMRNPPTDPTRTVVDHADRDPSNDTERNLHWVTPVFNMFNHDRKPAEGRYYGVQRSHNTFWVSHRGREQGAYSKPETAALVYNLLCRLQFGNQLDKTPDLLNEIKNEDSRVRKVVDQHDGVQVYAIDDIFIVVCAGHVDSSFAKLADASVAAKGLVKRLEAERKQEEETWAAKRRTLKISRRAVDQVAYVQLSKDGTTVDVLLDDEDWLDLHARNAKLFIGLAHRVTIRFTDGSTPYLSRWLLKADERVPIVDHISVDVYDHRRKDLRPVDPLSNLQNVRQAKPGQ